MPTAAHAASPPPFSLSRRFAVVALLSITVLAVALGALLNRFITQRLLWQEAVLTKEFVYSLIGVEKSLQAFFASPTPMLYADTELAFRHIAAMPDMLRANVFDPSRRMIWSSERERIGAIAGPNAELEAALRGSVVTQVAQPHGSRSDKAEHQNLKSLPGPFVEIYVPVLDARAERVLAVIEFYKNPRALAATLDQLQLYIALGAAASGALLFAALFWLVRRADLTIRRQQRHLVENETLAVIGEMSAAVAHGLRNPLAAIRSSAELIPGGDLAQAHDAAHDIMGQADRLEVWVRELLAYTRPLDEASAPVALQPLVARCLDEFGREMQRREIRSQAVLDADLPAVRGDALLLGQVLNSVLANAIEALDRKGEITVRGDWVKGHKQLTLSVHDSGPGMTPAQIARAGKPFHTTKARGLGVGLALARRVVERFGGRLEIDSHPGSGTTVRLHMNIA